MALVLLSAPEKKVVGMREQFDQALAGKSQPEVAIVEAISNIFTMEALLPMAVFLNNAIIAFNHRNIINAWRLKLSEFEQEGFFVETAENLQVIPTLQAQESLARMRLSRS